MKGRAIKYTDAERDFIKANCTLVISELHQQFVERFERRDVSAANLNAFRKRNGWSTGRDGRFKPGHDGYKGGPKGPNKTSFKKGSVPPNRKPLYSERTDSDGYIYIKVPRQDPHTGFPTRYVLKHRWVWEQAGRTIPAGYVLVFVDGDRSNCALDNLELWTRAELAGINKAFANIDQSLKPAARRVVQIKQKTNQLRSRS